MPAKSPILISKSLTGIVNGNAPFIPEGFKNPLNQGAWLDEIRFTITVERADAGAWFGSAPDALRTAIRIGNTELTKGLIPAALLCMPRDWAGEFPSILANFLWRLPKPMYFPRNANLNVQVQQREDFFTANPLLMSVDVAALLRPTLEVPEFVHVPYASHFTGTKTTSTTATTEVSTPNDLRNPFRDILNVSRFSFTDWALPEGYDPTTGTPYTNGVQGQALGLWANGVGMCGSNLVRLFDRNGQPGVRAKTPVGVFGAVNSRAWKVNAVLKPNDYFIAELTSVADSGVSAARLAVAMVGYRTIPLADLGAAR